MRDALLCLILTGEGVNMKAVRNIFVVLFMLALILSCDPSSGTNNAEIDKSSDASFDEKTISAIGKLTITSTGTIRVEGDFKAGDGVLIKPGSSSRVWGGDNPWQ